MKLALNFLAVSPLLVVGIVALVVVGVAAVALVLVHTRRTGKKGNKNAVAEQLHTEAPAEQTKQPVPAADVEDDELGKDLVSAEVALNELESQLNEIEQHMSDITGEDVKAADVDAPATEVLAEEVTEQPVTCEIAEEPAVAEVAECVTEEPVAAPVAVQEKKNSEKINIRVSYNRSLTAKLIQAEGNLKDYYSDIKNELLSYKKVKSRMSWRYETFRLGRKLLAKFKVRGKTLNVYLALDPQNYVDTKYKIIDVSHVVCNASVPSLYKIKNERRRRYVKQLIAELMAANGAQYVKNPEVDYAEQYPYESVEALIEKNLVKLVPWKEFGAGSEIGVISVSEEDITEEIEKAMVTEEQPEVVAETVEEVAEDDEIAETAEEVEEEVAEDDEIVETTEQVEEPVAVEAPEGFVRIRVRYNRSFTAKLIQADDTVKNYYEQIKNELLRYKKIKSRISWRQETFRRGRKLLARMQIRGKTLSVYFALNPADYEGTKYKVLDVSQIARNAEVPALYKIKNDRRCRYAKDLIADVMTANGVVAGGEQNESYASQYPYEEIEPLIERKLVKLLPWKEFAAGSEVGVITVKEEEITEEIAMATEQPEQPAEDDYVEEAVSNFFDETEEEDIEEVVTAEPEMTFDVAEADEILSDEYVEAFVRQSERYSDRTKKAVVNIDTLGKYFNAGERVTVEEIKKRVPDIGGKVTYIKVLARGKLDKALIVEADDFSPQAIKMIVLTGGSVERKARK